MRQPGLPPVGVAGTDCGTPRDHCPPRPPLPIIRSRSPTSEDSTIGTCGSPRRASGPLESPWPSQDHCLPVPLFVEANPKPLLDGILAPGWPPQFRPVDKPVDITVARRSWVVLGHSPQRFSCAPSSSLHLLLFCSNHYSCNGQTRRAKSRSPWTILADGIGRSPIAGRARPESARVP